MIIIYSFQFLKQNTLDKAEMCDTFKNEFRCRNIWLNVSNVADFASSAVSLRGQLIQFEVISLIAGDILS